VRGEAETRGKLEMPAGVSQERKREKREEAIARDIQNTTAAIMGGISPNLARKEKKIREEAKRRAELDAHQPEYSES
jgi:hypothetical protein